MIRPFAVTLALVGTVLGGCERPAATTGNATATPTTDDAALQARIEALAPGQLRAVLFRAIRDAGQECQTITGHARLADNDRRPAWSAECDNRNRFMLTLNPGGVFAVTPGAALGQR
jgi:hypothetical protein